jgi:hypothetical protein
MKGQTLLEVLIGLSVATLVIGAISVLVLSGLNNSQFVKNQGQATQYAQEGMDIVRGIRATDYIGFRSYQGTYCLGQGQQTLGSASLCVSPNVDAFIRSVSIEQTPGCGTTLAKVVVTVSWKDARCQGNEYCHKSQLDSCLSTASSVKGL